MLRADRTGVRPLSWDVALNLTERARILEAVARRIDRNIDLTHDAGKARNDTSTNIKEMESISTV